MNTFVTSGALQQQTSQTNLIIRSVVVEKSGHCTKNEAGDACPETCMRSIKIRRSYIVLYSEAVCVFRASCAASSLTGKRGCHHATVEALIPNAHPQLLYKPTEEPPEYFEAAGTSPLPTYYDVLYNDQLIKSFSNLAAI
ncbi:hypothetical protein TELCIR_06689 [Teladorsagia circumcincta]|uniref:Uncharacterized protein n=1 Tax=Teladorsagia circumcincta TaxID=45464 RepID=A0A2G9UMG1_TELCI|nr:hypothetical protein TELCIR_06689 [Teladorsagia circumcincta]